MKLSTPLGDICVEVNYAEVDYTAIALSKVSGEPDEDGWVLFDVDARYKIVIGTDSIKHFPVRVKCYIKPMEHIVFGEFSGIESGERLALISLYNDEIKLSIGAYDELDWLELYAYTETGVEIVIYDERHLQYAYFCVAWVTLSDKEKLGGNGERENDIHTWFAADPSLI